jgi:hypothetical protein
MFGRTLRSNLAIDNGRSAEFIRRRSYPDKSRCYECGEDGHLSYKCPKNALGERDPPPKKDKKRKKENSKAEKSQVCSFVCLVTVHSVFPEHFYFECIRHHRLRVFKNKVLRRIFGLKRDEVTGGWRKLHNKELHGLYSSPSIIRITKSRMR